MQWDDLHINATLIRMYHLLGYIPDTRHMKRPGVNIVLICFLFWKKHQIIIIEEFDHPTDCWWLFSRPVLRCICSQLICFGPFSIQQHSQLCLHVVSLKKKKKLKFHYRYVICVVLVSWREHEVLHVKLYNILMVCLTIYQNWSSWCICVKLFTK